MEREYRYNLPNAQNIPNEYTTKNNSVIIIGANGAGKSRLGAWMEQTNLRSVHRIGAQRSLQFQDYIELKSYEQASNLLLTGSQAPNKDHNNRWGHDGEKYNYTSLLLNDYGHVLSTLMAKKNKQQEEYIKSCKEKEFNGLQHNTVPELIVDTLQRIWGVVFPQRQIKLDDAKVIAFFNKNGNIVEYKGKEMSDGERVVLYLIAQALCVPDDKIIIVDEPEIHLHRSIMNRLWTAIENERQDCLFIYITHDTQFAANYKQSDKYWIKNYDGVSWLIEKIEESTLPEQLVLDIMGNRKPVLFVEGTSDSYDTKLYREIYSNYYIVPCGSCSTVIAQTKAMRANPQLHHLSCFGIIDRDFRSDYEIEKYKENNIFTLRVAEVENLFLVEELLKIVNSIMAFNDDTRIEAVKRHIIEDRFRMQLNRQICESIVAQLKYKLSTAEISKKNESEAKESLSSLLKSISYEAIQRDLEGKFVSIAECGDYAKILSIFNCKSLSTSTGNFFELNNKNYCDFVIRQLQGSHSQEIINAIKKYLPNEISV